jgi:hypothetical protein
VALGSLTALFAERAITLYRVSSLTGVPVRKVQEWAGLGALFAAAACSAAVAGWLVSRSVFAHAPLAQLAEGAAITALVYPVALVLVGQRRLLSELFGLLLREKQPAPNPQPE